MKTLTKVLSFLLVMLLVISCGKEEIVLPVGEELSDAAYLKSAKVLETPMVFSGMSNYQAYVPKTGDLISGGALEFTATLNHHMGQNYQLDLVEVYFPGVERHVSFPLKISPAGIVKGCWPEEWYDFMNPPEGGEPNTDVIAQITAHTGCDLHGPGISKGTINCKGTFDGSDMLLTFYFNGMDNGIESSFGPDSPWNLIDGPAKFEFSYNMTKVE